MHNPGTNQNQGNTDGGDNQNKGDDTNNNQNNNDNDDDNNKLLIKNLKGIENRSARYVCAICIYYPDGKYLVTEGTVEGVIIDTPKGENGFGYDPYFYIEDFKKTFAEVPLELKNTISHRARAISKMKELINEDFTYKR